MTLSPGARLGPYEIVAPLGAGGMGEVYRARDTRLGRDVAVKVLPGDLAATPEVRARFEREARAVSSLNHPHICTLHDIGREGEIDFLVMELVDGETLGARIARGALPTADVVRIGAQIADALDQAHRAGVVHRDLKPGNIMLTKSGAKLMDFGLARATGPAAAASGSGAAIAALSQSPTMSQPLTVAGHIVGTFQYMSPEQLEGKEADARSDLWALGCVLYEMASGKRPFEGASQASLIGSIMKDAPRALGDVAPMTPATLDSLVRMCLAKDPEDRWQRAHDVRLMLEALPESGSSASSSAAAAGTGTTGGSLAPATAQARRGRSAALLIAAGLIAGLAGGYSLATLLRPAAVTEPARIRTITYSGEDLMPSCSPDRRSIAFASLRSGVSRIWLKSLASGDEVALTDGEDLLPRFSPDGSQILFVRVGRERFSLWRVPIVGGQARRLVDDAIEGAWSPDGAHLAFHRRGFQGDSLWAEVWVASADGSNPRRIHRVADIALRWLAWSPDSREILVGNVPRANAPIDFLVLSIADGSARVVDPKAGLSRTSNPVWLGSGDRICYAITESRATTITGQASRLYVQSLRTGEAREILSLPTTCVAIEVLGEGRLVLGAGQFAQNLLLVDKPGTPEARERWLTRGASTDRQPAFSPDGTKVIFSSNRAGNLDLWELALESGSILRLIDDPGQDWDPRYTPDGRGIVWSSDRTGSFEIWMSQADGSAPRQITRDSVDAENPAMTPDGEWILYLSGRTDAGVMRSRLDGSRAQVLVPGGVTLPELSPSGEMLSAVFGLSVATGGIRIYSAHDGSPLPGFIPAAFSAAGGFTNAPNIATGRHRWIGDDRIAYVDVDSLGHCGVSIRDVSPNGVGPPAALAGFHPNMPTESFGVASNGSRIVISVRSANQTLMLAENVPGIDPPVARAKSEKP